VAGGPGEPLEAHALLDLLALVLGATVVPEDRRAQRLVVRAERHQSVHLPSQADAVGLVRSQLLQHAGGAAPPVVGILLAPASPRR